MFSVWTEVQRDFSTHIKEFQHQFDMILEGAKQLDLAKVELQSAEQKEGKDKVEGRTSARTRSMDQGTCALGCPGFIPLVPPEIDQLQKTN